MTKTEQVHAEKRLTTYEVVTLALYLEGGVIKAVDAEDIAVRANELAPGEFAWRKYADQINLDKVLVSLRHAKRKGNGQLVVGGSQEGWRLTESGRVSALDCQSRSNTVVRKASGLSKAEKKWAQHERRRLLAEPAFAKWQEGNPHNITTAEAERFFKVDGYLRDERRRAIVSRVCNIFADDTELGAAAVRIKKELEEV